MVFEKTTGGDLRTIVGMLYGLKAGPSASPQACMVKWREADAVKLAVGAAEVLGERFKSGDQVVFEVLGGKLMTLLVMSPLELGEKLTELEVKDDWTIGEGVKAFL